MAFFLNGHCVDFLSASGALAFRGEGWWFEKPAFWMGWLRPSELTIITKTLTMFPRKGNLRHWCPWRCVQPINRHSTVNAVALTNPGLLWWISKCYPYITWRNYKVIVSVMPETFDEARDMIGELNRLPGIVGIELNLACPNVKHDDTVDCICALAEECATQSRHPLILKLGIDYPYVEICKNLDGRVAAFDLINAVKWRTVYPQRHSPLSPYGLVGGVSGRDIRSFSRKALKDVKEAGIKTPIISGGGIDSYEEAECRFAMGAGAVSFGVLFMFKPWAPNLIASKWRQDH